jgi:hypothetical protein
MSIIFLSFVKREREGEEKEVRGGSERCYIWGGGQEHNIFGLEGSQAVPASSSGMEAYDQN